MNDEIIEKYMKAGAIAAEARDKGSAQIKPGVSFLDIVSTVEEIIEKRGAAPSFPVNISVNEIAAHFSPLKDDTHVFKTGDVVKLDVGTHIDGYIADTAVTTEVGSNEYASLISASEEALQKVIAHMKPGVSLNEIGKMVQQTIQSYEFQPIENLTGHSLNQYSLHSGMSIPNVASIGLKKKPKAGDAIAVEPFATTGSGRVVSQGKSNIYLINNGFRLRQMRDRRAKLQIRQLKKAFHSLPFTTRWCEGKMSNVTVSLQRLSHLGLLHHYPQLVEQNKGIVSQKEHTLLITTDGCQVTTYSKHES